MTSTTNLGFLVNKKLCDSTLQHNHSVVLHNVLLLFGVFWFCETDTFVGRDLNGIGVMSSHLFCQYLLKLVEI